MFGELPWDMTFQGSQLKFEGDISLTLQLRPIDFLNLDRLGRRPGSLRPITVCWKQWMSYGDLVRVDLGFRDPKINKDRHDVSVRSQEFWFFSWCNVVERDSKNAV